METALHRIIRERIEQIIDDITAELQPEDVFDESALQQWVESNDYTKIKEKD